MRVGNTVHRALGGGFAKTVINSEFLAVETSEVSEFLYLTTGLGWERNERQLILVFSNYSCKEFRFND